MFASTNPFGQSLSSLFGSSQSVFGQQNKSNNPFAPKPIGSPTPLGSQMGNSAGVFGATQTSSPFSSNTTSSASSSPAFNSSMPAFGVSYAPSFGNSLPSSGVFGQKPAFGSSPTQTSPFGSAIQPPQQAFGSNTQQSQPAFGSSIFDSSTPFCASSQPAFGSTSTPAFGATSTPAYGATTPAFSFGSSTQAFGQSSSAFGTRSPFGSTTSAFGGQSSAFASHTPTQTFENTGSGQSEFGRQRGGSRVASYSATTEPDGGSGQLGKFESISSMSFYKDKSHEELRWEDYQLGDKGGPLASAPQSTGMAGFKSYTTKTNAFSRLVFGQSSANPVSSTTSNSNNPFAPKTSTFSSGFGTSAPVFSSSAFDSSSTSAFGTSSTLATGASSIPAFDFRSSTEACGPQVHTQAFVGQSGFVGQRCGSRVASYSATTEMDVVSGQPRNLESISAMPTYKDKSHEELRWEDYQLGTKAFGQSSSRPLGSSQSAFGQQNNSSTNPSASKPFGSPTPLGLQTGNSSTSAGVFGATPTLSPFSSNTTSTSTPAFGATSTSAFGATTPAFSFGSSTEGQSSSAFGTSSPFGSTTSAFGGQSFAFGSHTPTQTFENTGIGKSEFGRQQGGSRVASYSATTEQDGSSGLQQAPQSTGMAWFNSSTTQTNAFSPSPVFGQSSANPFSSTTLNSNNPSAPKNSTFASGFGTSASAFSSSAFGSSSTSAFGTSSSLAFGASSIPAFSFGSSTKACSLSSSAFGTCYPFGNSTSTFGGQSSVFGTQTTTQTFANTAIGQSEFVADIPSLPTENLESISAILFYKDKSHEELRWEDYELASSASTNAQSASEFGQNIFPFGQTTGFRPPSFFSSLSSGLVGNIFPSRASLTSNAPDRAVSLAILTGTVLATVVVSGWISLRCRRA